MNTYEGQPSDEKEAITAGSEVPPTHSNSVEKSGENIDEKEMSEELKKGLEDSGITLE
jgi:hypothetical protein